MQQQFRMTQQSCAEKVSYLYHVLDPTVRVLLNDRLDPDQGLHLSEDIRIKYSSAGVFTSDLKSLQV